MLAARTFPFQAQHTPPALLPCVGRPANLRALVLAGRPEHSPPVGCAERACNPSLPLTTARNVQSAHHTTRRPKPSALTPARGAKPLHVPGSSLLGTESAMTLYVCSQPPPPSLLTAAGRSHERCHLNGREVAADTVQQHQRLPFAAALGTDVDRVGQVLKAVKQAPTACECVGTGVLANPPRCLADWCTNNSRMEMPAPLTV